MLTTVQPQSLSLTHLVAAPRQSPAPGEQPPLLVLLHGVGSNERDLFSLAQYLDPRFLIVSARGPITLGPSAYGWYHLQWTPEGPIGNDAEADSSRTTLLRFLPEAQAAYGADPTRTYLMGFSQGAIMSLFVALTHPEAVTGIVPMSGRLLPQTLSERADDDALTNLPICAVHGTRDAVLPIAYGREIHEELSKLPVALTYREYNMAHEVSGESLSDISVWLTAQLDAR